MINLMHGDCLEVLRTLPDNSVDAVVTDPPYGLSFMGKKWDYDVPATEVWAECLRVLKPGGHLLAFAGTRTQHRMAVRIEDAGFEIRDLIMWCYGSGFPKSLDVSKQIDQQEKNIWVKISNAIDNASLSEIAELWINSKNANAAGLSFRRKQTEAGLNTQKKGFAHGSVLLQASHKNCDALAVIAELNSTEAHPTSEGSCSSAQSNAESTITASKSHANTAESSPENREATLCMVDFSALHSAWDWQGESKADKLKAVEALKIWLGSKPSSRRKATSALCAALTDDLKLITLSQSKTFLSFDTTRQMACASVISATITESTAESLISFTADTLKSKAIDKAAGAEREKVLVPTKPGNTRGDRGISYAGESFSGFTEVSEPVTEAARQWQGWGTALKPALEPVTVARKPLSEGTVAANVLAHGTGAINVDGCRVNGGDSKALAKNWDRATVTDMRGGNYGNGEAGGVALTTNAPTGRWPANLIHDGSEDVVGLLPDRKPATSRTKRFDRCFAPGTGYQGGAAELEKDAVYGDSGSAARFFYCAKASKRDRDEGLEGFEVKRTGGMQATADGSMLTGSGNERTTTRANIHPTVKPTDLMRYLCRLVTPPGGIVLDPFMGSGSTGKAARLEGFQFIGIEREEEYLEIARARINAVQVNLL